MAAVRIAMSASVIAGGYSASVFEPLKHDFSFVPVGVKLLAIGHGPLPRSLPEMQKVSPFLRKTRRNQFPGMLVAFHDVASSVGLGSVVTKTLTELTGHFHFRDVRKIPCITLKI